MFNPKPRVYENQQVVQGFNMNSTIEYIKNDVLFQRNFVSCIRNYLGDTYLNK